METPVGRDRGEAADEEGDGGEETLLKGGAHRRENQQHHREREQELDANHVPVAESAPFTTRATLTRVRSVA